MDEDNKENKKKLEEADAREKELKANLKDTTRKVDDLESKVRKIRLSLESIWQLTNDICYIEPGDMGGNLTEARNTVVFIGSLIKDWIGI